MKKLTYKEAAFSGCFAVAEQDITPPVAIYSRNWGAAAYDQADGVHRPLMMQVLAIASAQHDGPLLLVTADLGWWKNQADERKLREALLETFGLRAHQLVMCLSHTHAGPSICSDDADKPGGEHIVPYLARLESVATELAEEALGRLAPGTLSWHYGVCDLATNRDLVLEEACLVGFNPGERADQTLLVGRIESEGGAVMATVVNYACHPTTLAHENRMLSPDYIGAMRELVSERTGAPCLFIQGASGELAPREQYVASPAVADRHGRQLGYAVLATLTAAMPNNTQFVFKQELPSGAPLAIWDSEPVTVSAVLSSRIVTIEVPVKDLASLAEIQSQWQAAEDRVTKDRLWRKLNTRRALGDGPTTALQVWLWQLGDAYVVAQANETYSAYQREIREAFPHAAVAVANIANGYVGYLPPAEQYDQDKYAVWQTPFGRGALEELTNRTIDAINENQP